MDKKQNFVRTTCHGTVQKLINEGFTLISNNGSEYVFLNNGKVLMDKLKEVAYTNKLCL
jgi:hypothetical protein